MLVKKTVGISFGPCMLSEKYYVWLENTLRGNCGSALALDFCSEWVTEGEWKSFTVIYNLSECYFIAVPSYEKDG